MTREEFITCREYWLGEIQFNLYDEIDNFMKENNINRSELAEMMGVTKGYISQILNGDFNHRISKLVELALFIGKAPHFDLIDIEEIKKLDKLDKLNSIKYKNRKTDSDKKIEKLKSTSTKPVEYEIPESNLMVSEKMVKYKVKKAKK